MRLLLDANLSPRLVRLLDDLFPGSAHVSHVGLERASDDQLWVPARAQPRASASGPRPNRTRSAALGQHDVGTQDGVLRIDDADAEQLA